MVNRLVSVGDDFTLPDAVKVEDTNLPARLGAGELNATILDWLDRAYPVDIIVVGGQSNSTKADWYDVPPETVDPWVMKWVPGQTSPTPFAADDSQLGQFFAQEYVRQFPRRRALVVTAGVGDTGLRLDKSGGTWDLTDATNPINLYTRMVDATNAAKAWVAANTTTPSTQVRAVLWSGFEADSKVFTQDLWRAKMTGLIDAYRTVMGDTFKRIPFILGSMTPELFYEYDEALPRGVRWAIEDMPRWIQHTAYAFGPRDTSKYGERIHFSVEGQRRRARLFIEGLRRARVNYTSTTQKPLTPTGLNVERNGTTALITWDAPYARATKYELRISTDEGVTWTDVTLPRPLMHEYAMTAPATTPVWARVRAVNDTLFSPWSFPAPTLPEPARPGSPLYSLTSRDLLTTADLTTWTPTPGSVSGTALITPSGANGPNVEQDAGINVVKFNGTTERLSTAGAVDVWKTLFAVVKLPAATTGVDWIFGAEQASNPYVGYDSSTGLVYAYNGTATNISTAAAPGWHFIAYTIDASGAATLTVDGVTVSGTLATTPPAPGLRLAGSFATSQHAAVSFVDIDPRATVASAGDITAQRAWAKRVYPMLLA